MTLVDSAYQTSDHLRSIYIDTFNLSLNIDPGQRLGIDLEKSWVLAMCSCDQYGRYDDKRANSSYKRPWIATNGQQMAASAPLRPYGVN